MKFGLLLSFVYECLCFWQLTKGTLKIYSTHSCSCVALGLSPHNFVLLAPAREMYSSSSPRGSWKVLVLPWYCFFFQCQKFVVSNPSNKGPERRWCPSPGQYAGTGTVLASECFSSTAISIPTNSDTRSGSIMALNVTKIINTIYPMFIYTKVILLICYFCNFKNRQPRDSYFCKSKSYFLWQDALLHTNWNKARTDGAVPNWTPRIFGSRSKLPSFCPLLVSKLHSFTLVGQHDDLCCSTTSCFSFIIRNLVFKIPVRWVWQHHILSRAYMRRGKATHLQCLCITSHHLVCRKTH